MTSNLSVPIQVRRSRTVAIMQPYLFPYIGYYQLLVAADCFIVYDDVQFIKGGWINRNRLLINGTPFLFTVPLNSPSPNRNICEIDLGENALWYSKLLQTIAQGYHRAPYFEQVFALLERVLNNGSARTIADLIRVSFAEITAHLGLTIEIVPTSAHYGNQHLRSQERVLDICRLEQATDYVNAQGGRVLYNQEVFSRNGLQLHFLEPALRPYRQVGKGPFIPGLSIIDVLMNTSVDEANALLRSYQLT